MVNWLNFGHLWEFLNQIHMYLPEGTHLNHTVTVTVDSSNGKSLPFQKWTSSASYLDWQITTHANRCHHPWGVWHDSLSILIAIPAKHVWYKPFLFLSIVILYAIPYSTGQIIKTVFVVWPTTSCFADWSKRRHVTFSIIECWASAMRPSKMSRFRAAALWHSPLLWSRA